MNNALYILEFTSKTFNRHCCHFNHMRLTTTLTTFCLAACALNASAAMLTWDPNQTSGANPGGSGNWDTTDTFWYNGTSDIAWSQTSTTSATMGAIFGGTDAAPGTYNVTNSAVQVAVTNLTINNNGYAFYGSAIYLANNDTLSVAANKTVTFNCGMAGGGASPFWVLGAGATMNVTGGMATGQQTRAAGAAGSAFNLTGNNTPAIFFILGNVNVSAGLLAPTSTLHVGYPFPSTINGVSYTTGTLTISGTGVVTANGNVMIIGRTGGTGTVNLNGGALNVGTTAAKPLAVNYDGSAGSSGTLNVSGGTLTVGSSTLNAVTSSAIDFFDTSESTGTTATMNQTGGTVLAWGGLYFGAGSGTPGTANLINTGGFLYLGKNGLAGNTVLPTLNINLSGGTVGALANWSTVLPITLGTTNGNITFQAADNNGSPFNISLACPLSGPGGLNVTGPGTVSLSGTNTYTGTTVVSNGTLAIVTGSTPNTNGSVTVDGTSGSSTLAMQVSSPGQSWYVSSLGFSNGTPSATFAFGSLAPSTSTASLQVSGNVSLTATPSVTISGTAIANGTYPLIKYSGTFSGALPGSVSVPGYISAASLTNNAATKTISLVVTGSTYNPALYWGVGNGVWDINTTTNWKQFSSAAKYQDGQAVVFDDSASGPSPITVTLNTIVNPLSITANNSSNQYTIGGSGSIAGSAAVTLLNNGSFALAGKNTYTGGTVVGSTSTLDINNGGNATSSAIGTGTLTLNAGATIDNTSGSNVTLAPSIPETWNGGFTYAGSSTNFNTGTGAATMNADVPITVNSNNLTIGGSITDNGLNYALSKKGNGSLTLAVANSFNGGFNVSSGLVNIGDPGALGTGTIKFSGGSIDNVTGAPLIMNLALSYVWGGSFSFLGSADLNLNVGLVSIPNGLGSITVNIVSNTLTTIGDIQNNNTSVIKTGNGTWAMTGGGSSLQSLGLFVTAGQVLLDKTSGQAITGGNNVGLTVQSGGFVQDEASFEIHSDSAVALPVNLFGGTYDLHGFNENIDKLALTTGGTLQNSAAATSTVNLISGYTASLTGADCQFEVDSAMGAITFQGPIGGSGSLVKTGAGTLNLLSNNVYTGDTVISNGTIALVNSGTLSNTDFIDLVTTNSLLDLSGETNSQTLTLQSGQVIGGFGTLNGSLDASSGGGVDPGSSTNIGTLTITGAAVLGGPNAMEINDTAHTSSQLAVTGSLAYGGTLTVGNLAGTPGLGDTFALFSAVSYSGSFASISLPPVSPGLAWDRSQLQTAASGSIRVVVPTQPHILGSALSGSTLTLHGGNGLAYEPFVVLQSPTLNAPLSTWTQAASGTFDASGNFNISFATSGPQEFYVIQLQP